MKRQNILIIIIISVIIVSACSVRNDVVVVNDSDEPIEVQYQFEPNTSTSTPSPTPIRPPAKLNAKEILASGRQWRDVPEEQFHYDNLTGRVTVTLAPAEALLIGYVYNHNAYYLNLANLSITGEWGSIRLEGRQAHTQFREESGSYLIRYK